MLQDVANVWWAIIIANTLHQIVWFALLFAQQMWLQRHDWAMFIPDLVTSIVSANVFVFLLSHWGIDYPDVLYAILVYVAVVNLTNMAKLLKLERGEARKLQWFWIASSNIGFLVFTFQMALMTWVF
jgi:hypothetical protein